MEYVDFLNRYIPSEDCKAKIRETGHVFTDQDMAAMVWNSDEVLEDRLNVLEEIADQTSEETLRAQIRERIAYEGAVIKAFYDNDDGFIYILNSHEYRDEGEDDIIGYYSDGKYAWEEGCNLGFGFDIAKHQLINRLTIKCQA